jgi:hypothetical protein
MKPSPLCLPADMPELSQSRFRTTAVELGRAIQSKFGGLRKPSKPRLRDRSVVSPVRCRGLSHSDHACAVWRRAVLPRGDAFGLRQSGAGAFPCGPDDNPLRRIDELHTNCRASDPMAASSAEYEGPPIYRRLDSGVSNFDEGSRVGVLGVSVERCFIFVGAAHG